MEVLGIVVVSFGSLCILYGCFNIIYLRCNCKEYREQRLRTEYQSII